MISPMHFFFFNDTATTEIYTLSLHDALPIYGGTPGQGRDLAQGERCGEAERRPVGDDLERARRSEEHTSELQSQSNLVCRLLLEKKKKRKSRDPYNSLSEPHPPTPDIRQSHT